MRTSLMLTLFFSLIIATACKKDFPDDPFDIRDYSVSECKFLAKGSSETEFITLKTIDNYYLLFSHVNSHFNCSPGQITVTPAINGNIITLDENESQSGANCICPYDINFKIGPLRYGTYSLILQRAGQTFREYDLDFTNATDINLTIAR